MYRIASLLTASLIALTSVSAVAAPQTLTVADSELSLSGAKHIVADYLKDSGNRTLKVGRAEFTRNGNVDVEIVTLQGIPLKHVVVDGKSGDIADARTHAPLSKKG